MGSRAYFGASSSLSRASRALAIGCVLGLAIAGASSCAPPQPFVWASRLPPTDDKNNPLRIGPGDEIYVLVADQQALSGAFTIGPEGSYVQPVVGAVSLLGLTTKEATQQLTARLSGILVRPQVTITVTKRRPLRISVIGQVTKPGRFEVPYDESVLATIALAGGLTEFADDDAIYVIRRDPHLLRIRFRMRDLAGPDGVSARFRLNDGDVIVVE
jgi:polysaccharide export outer membrane protein